MAKIRKPDYQNPPMNINMFKCPDCGEWFHISFGHTCKKSPTSISTKKNSKQVRGNIIKRDRKTLKALI